MPAREIPAREKGTSSSSCDLKTSIEVTQKPNDQF